MSATLTLFANSGIGLPEENTAKGDQKMGMDSELLAVGPYGREVADVLGYPADFYSDTPEGAMIITPVILCETDGTSYLLADALGIRPWAFEEHCDILSRTKLEDVDLELLARAAQNTDDVAVFLKLASNGFKFYFLPNG